MAPKAAKIAGVPFSCARAVCVPGVAPSVHAVRAVPSAPDTRAVGPTEPPPSVTVKSIVAPPIGFANASRNCTASESVSGWPSVPLCASPPTIASTAGAAGVIVIVALVSAVSAPLVAISVRPVAVLWMLSALNVATPATALTVVAPASVAPVAPASSAMVTGPVKSGVRALPASRTSTVTGVNVAPAIAVVGAEVITTCVGMGAVPVAVTTRVAPAIPVTVAVIDCTPSNEPRVHEVLTTPSASEVSADAASVPPPVVTTNVTGRPATPTLSDAATRKTSGAASAVPMMADCVAPEIDRICDAGSLTWKTEVSAFPLSRSAITVPAPRFAFHVTSPLPGEDTVARVVSALRNRTGVFGMTLLCASRAAAENCVVVPDTTVPVSGVRVTEDAVAPVPV